MRLTSTTSRYATQFAGSLILLCLPWIAQASTSVTGSGCFVRTGSTVRMTTPSCTLTFSNSDSTTQPYAVTIENIDPDAVTIDNYDTTIGLTRTDTTLQFTVDAEPGDTTTTINPWHDPGSDYYYVAISDNQARGTVEANPVFQDVVQDIGVVNPAFYTDSGDLVQGSSDTATLADMFQAVLDSANAISVPMYPIAGNHDYSANLAVYASYFGQPDYTFTYGTADFIALSTSINSSRGGVTDDQLNWLSAALAASTVDHRLVFFHHPLAVPSWGRSSCCFEDTANRDALAGVLEAGNIDLVITGHSQGYDDRTLTSADVPSLTTGFEQLVTGGSGGHIAEPGGQHHFTLMHVSPAGVVPTMISSDSFATAISYNHNDGGSTTPQATIENASSTDLPYVRLKFKIAGQAESYSVSDDAGNSYTTFYIHDQSDYTVLYLEVSAAAHSSATYTVQPTAGISAVPHGGTTSILNVSTDPALSWIEEPSSTDVTTDYTITALPADQDITVSMNSQVLLRKTSDDSGTIGFTVQDQSSQRLFTVAASTHYPRTIITVPTSNGRPQVRLFDTAGVNKGNWYALDATTVAPYQVMAADFDNDGKSEVVVRRADQEHSSIGLYQANGSELAAFTGSQHLLHAQVDSQDGEEIFAIQNFTEAKISSYQYDPVTAVINVVQTKKLIEKNSGHPIQSTIVNVIGDTQPELVTVVPTTRGKVILSVWQWQDTGWTQFAETTFNGQASSVRAVVVAQLKHHLQPTIFVWQNSHLVGYRVTDSGILDRVVSQKLKLTATGSVTALAHHFLSGVSDQICFTSDALSMVNCYRWSNSKYRAWQTLTPWTGSAPLQFGIVAGKLVISQLVAPGQVSVYNYGPKTDQFTQAASWYGYGSQFTGGTTFAQ